MSDTPCDLRTQIVYYDTQGSAMTESEKAFWELKKVRDTMSELYHDPKFEAYISSLKSALVELGKKDLESDHLEKMTQSKNQMSQSNIIQSDTMQTEMVYTGLNLHSIRQEVGQEVLEKAREQIQFLRNLVEEAETALVRGEGAVVGLVAAEKVLEALLDELWKKDMEQEMAQNQGNQEDQEMEDQESETQSKFKIFQNRKKKREQNRNTKAQQQITVEKMYSPETEHSGRDDHEMMRSQEIMQRRTAVTEMDKASLTQFTQNEISPNSSLRTAYSIHNSANQNGNNSRNNQNLLQNLIQDPLQESEYARLKEQESEFARLKEQESKLVNSNEMDQLANSNTRDSNIESNLIESNSSEWPLGKPKERKIGKPRHRFSQIGDGSGIDGYGGTGNGYGCSGREGCSIF